MLGWSAALILSLCFASLSVAQHKRVVVDVVPSSSSLKAGDDFQIAVRFKIESGWHMYWLNPGDSGLPPTVEWTAPEGIKIDPKLAFPPPKRIAAGEDLISYGYEHELVVFASATSDRQISGAIRIDAKVSWLVCKDTCISEKADTSTTIAIGPKTAPNPSFQAFPSPATVQAAKTEHGDSGVELSIDKTAGVISAYLGADDVDPARVDLFPPSVEYAEFGKPTIVKNVKGSAITIPFRVLPGMKEAADGDAMLVRTDDKGNRTGTLIPLRFDFVK